jgi:hypothetical protein
MSAVKPSLAHMSFKSMPSHMVRRMAYAAITVVAVLLTLLLLSARDRNLARAQDAAVQAAWQSAAPPAGLPLSREAVLARFGVRQPGAAADLNWQAATMTELRASLLAFDLAQIRLTQVKITRNGAGFVVTAERAQ